jgi:apolipoprotein D and lipocalin family protein
MKFLLPILLIAAAANSATAAAPQPVQPVALTMYSGRWYEIARIAEGKERRCGFPTTDFAGHEGGGFSVIETCHDASPDGAAHSIRASVNILPDTGAAKIRMSFLGGLFHQEYWILDHAADDNAWALMATPGGRYLWLLSRRPALTPQEHAAGVGRITVLGYDLARLKPSR